MPYIADDAKRARIRVYAKDILKHVETSGDMNYVITMLLHGWHGDAPLNYEALLRLVGTLEMAKLELYRAVVGPYEDSKRCENGAVSALDGR